MAGLFASSYVGGLVVAATWGAMQNEPHKQIFTHLRFYLHKKPRMGGAFYLLIR